MPLTHTATPEWGDIHSSIQQALSRVPTLTERQRDVLMAFCDGPTDRTLARRLEVSVFTVRDHIDAAKRQLGVNSRTALGIVGYLLACEMHVQIITSE